MNRVVNVNICAAAWIANKNSLSRWQSTRAEKFKEKITLSYAGVYSHQPGKKILFYLLDTILKPTVRH